MKKIAVLLASVLAVTTITGCDLIDQLTPDTPEEQDEEQKSDKYPLFFFANNRTDVKVEYEAKGSFLIPECEFEYEDHTFLYWAEDDIEGSPYYPGQSYDVTSSGAFYAIWEDESGINFNVSFNSNGGTGEMESITIYSSTYKAPVCTFSKENYDFDKWALGSVSGQTYYPGATIEDIDSDIVLYALWKEKAAVNYTVSFDANGGQGTMSNKTTTGSTYVVPNCTFTKTDYTFKNWALNSKTGVSYNPGETIVNISSNITLYAIWQDKSSIDDYYAACEGLSGDSLLKKLKEINPAKNPSYDWSRYEDADEALDDSSSILSLYTRHNIKKSSHCGNYAWDKWNREHIWTQSSYPASKTDNHNIFACEGQINGYRSDKPFAEGGETVVVFGHTTGCKQTGDTFEPCDEAKGEVARSVMYGTVMYDYTMTKEIESIYLALKWHIQHPITERDTRRNEIVYKNQGNRNPFVDHPEYACKIWGNTNSQTKSICGVN